MSAQIPSASSAFAAFFAGAAIAPVEPSGWIRATGADRTRWLNGMVTNSVQALNPGQGAYTFLLNAQGRIQGDAYIWADQSELLVQTTAAQIEPMMALLDRFIIMDEVELADISAEMHGIRLAGPDALKCLQAAGIAISAADNSWTLTAWMGHAVRVHIIAAPSTHRIELWTREPQAAIELLNALVAHGATQATAEDFEALRITEGIPAFGVDIRERDLPQETAQTRALHFNKGCYLGQEIVERIRSRGAVHRGLQKFSLSSLPASLPAPLAADGNVIGDITSAAQMSDGIVGLGIVRRDAVERGATITLDGGTAVPIA